MNRFASAFALFLACSPLCAAGLGKPAPPFSLASLRGDAKVQLHSFAGKVVLLDFWASWCEPCRKAMPELARLRERHPGLVVVGISVDEERANALRFLKGADTAIVALFDDKQKIADAYALQGMPTGFLIDKRGILRYRHDGYGEGDMEQVETEAKTLMEEIP